MARDIILALLLGWGFSARAAVITKTVCPLACDYSDPQSAENSLPASLSDTYIFEWQAGQTFTQTLTIRNLAMNGNWVIHRSSQVSALPAGVRAGASSVPYMAAIQNSAAGIPAIATEQSASYHRFEGLEIKANSGLSNEPYYLVALFFQAPGSPGIGDNMRSDLAHHIVFDRCYIHNFVDSNQGNILLTAVAPNTGYFELTNSTVMAFNINLESHAVGAYNGEGPFYFSNNEFESSQIGTLFGGAQPTITGIRANGLDLLGNYYYRPWLWRVTSGSVDPGGPCQYDANGGESYVQVASGHWWLCVSSVWRDQGLGGDPIPYSQIWGAALDKNHFELKNAWGVTAQGNVLANGWQPAMLGQKGACVLLNQVDDTGPGDYEPQATIFGLQFTDNICDSTGHGIDIGVIGGPYNHVPDQISFANNLFTNIGLSNIVGSGSFDANLVEIQNAANISFDHNTLLLNNPSAGALGHGQLVQLNYLTWGSAQCWQSRPPGVSPPGILTWTNNIAVHGFWGLYDDCDSLGDTAGAIPYDYPGANIQSSIVITTQTSSCNPGGSGNCGQSQWASACAGCLFPTSFGSVFANYPSNLAVNSAYAGKGTLGTDPGVLSSTLAASTQETISGQPNSYLDFQVRSLLVAEAKADFTYTSPDTGACMLTLAENPALEAPVYQSTDGGGNRDRSVTATGLASRTRYWWTLDCGLSHSRRSGTLVTR
jgi:hypothetical protein